MKKFLLLISSALLTFGANAQVSKFEGASASVALAYQSYSQDVASFVTAGGTNLTVPGSASKGLVGKIGLDYTWRLSEENFLAIGFDYSTNGGGYGQANFTYQGAVQSVDQAKMKQKAKIFIAPSILINADTLGYIKLGYAQYQLKFATSGTHPSQSAITFGLGTKFMQSENHYFFVEANMLSGRSKTYTPPTTASTATAKPKGSEILVGYGVKF